MEESDKAIFGNSVKKMREKQNRNYFVDYILFCRNSNRADNTIKNYASDIQEFILWLEFSPYRKIENVNPEIITQYMSYLDGQKVQFRTQNFVQSLLLFFVKFFRPKTTVNFVKRERALSKNSAKRKMTVIRNFFEYLHQSYEDKIKAFEKNPVKTKIHSIQLRERDIKNTVVMTREQFNQLDEIIYRPEERLMIHLLYFAGLRLHELRHLKFSDFKRLDASLTLMRKGGKRHHYQLWRPDLIFDCLDKQEDKVGRERTFLFSSRRGGLVRERTLHNKIQAILKKGNLENQGLTAHSFRKGCATDLYIQTQDLLFVRDYLNHNDAKVTQLYIDPIVLQSRSQVLLNRTLH